MDTELQIETERLTRSWMQHDPQWLRDYLVSGVEDPRINVQSILSRHFLIRALFEDRFAPLMEQECRFGGIMNWLLAFAKSHNERQDFEVVLKALRDDVDNAEGVTIPRTILRTFASLPNAVGEQSIPNYIESFLVGAKTSEQNTLANEAAMSTFVELWRNALAVMEKRALLRVFEPACGSANDFRFLHVYGLTRFLDYTGLDLCPRNIENARLLFPQVDFRLGNIFELEAAQGTFDISFVHDLFEHLSVAGIDRAVSELCRVTRRGMCIGFFNMDEIPEHTIRPFEEYYWNTLSLSRMKELFAKCGFTSRVVHIGTYLRQQIGDIGTHNPNAYTFFLWRPQ